MPRLPCETFLKTFLTRRAAVGVEGASITTGLQALPQSWRHSDINLIPKPGKPLTLSDFCLISLTSCVGKPLESQVYTRILSKLETNSTFLSNMLDFRPHLSTQDALILIDPDLLRTPASNNNGLLLPPDIHKVFETSLTWLSSALSASTTWPGVPINSSHGSHSHPQTWPFVIPSPKTVQPRYAPGNSPFTSPFQPRPLLSFLHTTPPPLPPQLSMRG